MKRNALSVITAIESESSVGFIKVLTKVTTPSCKISRYQCALTLPASQTINGPGPKPVKHAQTITVTFPNFTVLSQCLAR